MQWLAESGTNSHLERVIAAIMLVPVKRAMLAWVEHAHDRLVQSERQPQAFKRAVAALALRGKSMCFRAWHDKVALRLERQRRLAVAAKEWGSGGGLRKGFFTWLDVYGQVVALRAKLVALRNPGIVKAFARWLEAADEAREGRRIASLGAKDLLSGGKYRDAFVAWLEMWQALRTALNAAVAMLSTRRRAALNTWWAATTTKRNFAYKMLEMQGIATDRQLAEFYMRWAARTLRHKSSLVAVQLWLRPAFDMWLTFWWLRLKASPLSFLGVRKAFDQWLALYSRSLELLDVRRMVARERSKAWQRGRFMMKRLRHVGLRGILPTWRHHMLSMQPEVSRSWVIWKGRVMLSTVAAEFSARRELHDMRRCWQCFQVAAFLGRLEMKLTAVEAGRRAKLKVWKVELMSAEAHSNLLARALDSASAKTRSTMRALEEERDAAIEAERETRERAAAEKRAALAALARRVPRPKSPKKVEKVIPRDPWSTAAARAAREGARGETGQDLWEPARGCESSEHEEGDNAFVRNGCTCYQAHWIVARCAAVVGRGARCRSGNAAYQWPRGTAFTRPGAEEPKPWLGICLATCSLSRAARNGYTFYNDERPAGASRVRAGLTDRAFDRPDHEVGS